MELRIFLFYIYTLDKDKKLNRKNSLDNKYQIWREATCKYLLQDTS